MMRGPAYLFLIGAQLLVGVGSCHAAPPGPPSEMPVAGPPPDADYLPSVSDAQRARAGQQMLCVVVGSLALIALLLRVVGKRNARAEAPKAIPQEESPFDRVRRALEGMDKGDGDGSGE